MSITPTTDTTAEVLAAMLQENTGTHFLDSGGYPKYDEHGNYAGTDHGYGRHWEQNKGRDFEGGPATILSFKYGIEVTHHVYHWLMERVEYDADMQERFEECCQEIDPDNHMWCLERMEAFPEWLRERGHEVTGLYGDSEPFTVNTYNGEDLLSQVLQFTYFELSEPGARWGQAYVLLQIHGGCDVRGGYTAPKAFRVTDDGACMLSNADATIHCRPRPTDAPGQLGLDGKPVPPPQPHYWTTDDGCHWYADGACGYGAGTQLEQYDRKDLEPGEQPEPGYLCVDADGHGYCPICGGRLEACP